MKLIIFDVDGTLVDSQNFIVEAQTRAFAAHAIAPPSRERMLSIVGLSLDQAFAELVGPDGPIRSLSQSYREAWQTMRLDPAFADGLYPGVAEMIARLAPRTDVMLGVATGKSRRGVAHMFEEQDWASLFATVQTSDDHPSKPHPSMILAALEETGTAPADAVMIGDTTYDMEMARAAGVRRIGVTWGYHAHGQLRDAGAERLVRDVAELMAVLENGACWD